MRPQTTENKPQAPANSPPSPQQSAGRQPLSPPTSSFSADGTCDRQVGFLFKRRCGRTSPQDCRDCKNGTLRPNQTLYAEDYVYYQGYGNYSPGRWGADYYSNRDRYYYDSNTRNVDFNESDAASFEQEGDSDYEMSLDAS